MSRENSSKKKVWQCEFSQDEIEHLDTNKLLFALEEARTYLENVSEKTNRLSNKGFILIGFAGGLLGFLLSMILELVRDPTNKVSSAIQNHWPTAILVGFCLVCALSAFYTLTRFVLFPVAYYPLGATPKNLLRKSVLEFGCNPIIVKQMELYQERIEENVSQNDFVSSCIRICLWLVFVFPSAAMLLWFMTTGPYCLR